jgi:hypothetical protein
MSGFEEREEHQVDGEVTVTDKYHGLCTVIIKDCLRCGCLFVGDWEPYCQRCEVEADRGELSNTGP